MKQQISYKNFFINYAVFILCAAFVFGILAYISTVSQKAWDKNLKAAVVSSMEEFEPDTWEIGSSIKFENPLSSSAACFEAHNKKSGENCKAVIIRLQTFYGPQCGIYIIGSQNDISFKGYSSLHGRVANQLKNSFSGRRIEYWNNRIEEMLK